MYSKLHCHLVEINIQAVKRGVRALRSKCSFINQQGEVRQARFRDSNRCNEGKAESATGAMRRSGQAANGQSHIGSPGKQTQGKCSEMSDGAKQDFTVNEMVSKAYIEWVMGCSCVISAMND